MKPRLLRSPVTRAIYIVTRYRQLGGGRFESLEKYEVTDEELAAVGLHRTQEDPDEERDGPAELRRAPAAET